MRKCKEKRLHSIAREKKGNYDFVPKFRPPPRINGIHDIVRPIVRDAQRKMYKDMNDYFKNILDAPSTINRIATYYHRANVIGDDKEYIAFVKSYDEKAVLVKEYDLDKYLHIEEWEQRIKLWMDYSIRQSFNDLIVMPPIPK